MSTRIQVGPHSWLLDPRKDSDLMQHEGDLAEFMARGDLAKFSVQQRNYRLLEASLVPFSIQMTHVWAGLFTDAVDRPRLRWLACDKDHLVFWQKAESPGPSTGHNHLYIRGQKIKVTTWLAMEPDQRAAIILPQGVE